MNNLFSDNNEATYCPEDDKLRLYVGRVPREEYLTLKREGWTSTPKQDCDFAAVWTIKRENTAISYAGYIGDEDQSPTDRAADRAERFAGYREKRREEAHGYADNFENRPIAHGYQNTAKANREAKKHEKIGVYACNQWEKAEYWQMRTAGVIHNALYRSSPGVRMGRIKKIEAEIRRRETNRDEYNKRRKMWIDLSTIEDKEKQRKYCEWMADDYRYTSDREHPKTGERMSLYQMLNHPKNPVSVLSVREIWLKHNPEDMGKTKYHIHLEMRLQYEKQMLEAAGGRAGDIEMQIGGKLYGRLIFKVNKSNQSCRVVSVHVLIPKVERYCYRVKNIPGTDYALEQHPVERLDPSKYTPPTAESIEEVKLYKEQFKATAPKSEKVPIINPTKESAELLQKIFNKKYISQESYITDEKRAEILGKKPIETTQKRYSELSKGAYSAAKTIAIRADGSRPWKKYIGYTSKGAVCRVRCGTREMGPYRVLIIKDKPQKTLPLVIEKVTT